MYSTHNERKSVVPERFIRTIKNKIYKDLFGNEVNDNDPKLNVGDHARILKYKYIFAKGYTVPWTYVIDYLNGEEVTGTFYEKEIKITDQQQFRIEKVIKKKGD